MTSRARALELAAGGELERAVELLERLRADAPLDATLALDLGLVLDARGRLDEAVEVLQAAVALDPAGVPGRRALASVLDRLDRLDEAVFQLQRARAADPGDAAAARELGAVLLRRGLPAKARAAFTEALALAPDDARAHYGLGLAHEGLKDAAAAIGAYRRAIALDPGFADPRLTLADTLAQLGEHDAAIAELDALLSVDRANERAAANREALEGALDAMRQSRLLGASPERLESSSLVTEGAFHYVGTVGGVDRWSCPWAELHVELDAERRVERLFLTLKDPQAATHKSGERFAVAVVDQSGQPAHPDWATAATLTLLREALGVPLTRAAALLEALYAGAPDGTVEVGGARARLDSRSHLDQPGESQHGVLVTLR